MSTHPVTAEFTPDGWWALEAPDAGAVSQVRELGDAADDIRAAIALLTDAPKADVEVSVRVVLDADEYQRLTDRIEDLEDLFSIHEAEGGTCPFERSTPEQFAT